MIVPALSRTLANRVLRDAQLLCSSSRAFSSPTVEEQKEPVSVEEQRRKEEEVRRAITKYNEGWPVVSHEPPIIPRRPYRLYGALAAVLLLMLVAWIWLKKSKSEFKVKLFMQNPYLMAWAVHKFPDMREALLKEPHLTKIVGMLSEEGLKEHWGYDFPAARRVKKSRVSIAQLEMEPEDYEGKEPHELPPPISLDESDLVDDDEPRVDETTEARAEKRDSLMKYGFDTLAILAEYGAAKEAFNRHPQLMELALRRSVFWINEPSLECSVMHFLDMALQDDEMRRRFYMLDGLSTVSDCVTSVEPEIQDEALKVMRTLFQHQVPSLDKMALATGAEDQEKLNLVFQALNIFASVMVSEKDTKGALEALDLVLTLDPANADLLKQVSDLAAIEGDMVKAERALRSSYELTQGAPDIALQLGKLLYEHGGQGDRLDEAVAVLRGAYKITKHAFHDVQNRRPGTRISPAQQQYASLHLQTLSLLTRALDRAGRQSEAMKMAHEWHNLKPKDPLVQYTLGRLLVKEKKFKDAQSYLETAFQARPKSSEIAYQLAVCAFDQSKLEQAMQWAEKASEIARNMPEPQPPKSQAEYDKIMRDQDRQIQRISTAEFLLGKIAFQQNNIDRALHHFNLVTRIEPHHPGAHFKRAECLKRANNPDYIAAYSATLESWQKLCGVGAGLPTCKRYFSDHPTEKSALASIAAMCKNVPRSTAGSSDQLSSMCARYDRLKSTP